MSKFDPEIEVSIPHSQNHFKYEMIDKILSKYLDFLAFGGSKLHFIPRS